MILSTKLLGLVATFGFGLVVKALKKTNGRMSSTFLVGSNLFVISLAFLVTLFWGPSKYSTHPDSVILDSKNNGYYVAHKVMPLLPFWPKLVAIQYDEKFNLVEQQFPDDLLKSLQKKYSYQPESPLIQYMALIIIGLWLPILRILTYDFHERKLRSLDSITGINHKLSALRKSKLVISEKRRQSTISELEAKRDALRTETAKLFHFYMKFCHNPEFTNFFPVDLSNQNPSETVLTWIADEMKLGSQSISTHSVIGYLRHTKENDLIDCIDKNESKYIGFDPSIEDLLRHAHYGVGSQVNEQDLLIEERLPSEQNRELEPKLAMSIKERLGLIIPDEAMRWQRIMADCMIEFSLLRVQPFRYNPKSSDPIFNEEYIYKLDKTRRSPMHVAMHDAYYVVVKCRGKSGFRKFFYKLDSVTPSMFQRRLMSKEGMKERDMKPSGYDKELFEAITDASIVASILHECFVPPVCKIAPENKSKNPLITKAKAQMKEAYIDTLSSVQDEANTKIKADSFELVYKSHPDLITNFVLAASRTLNESGVSDEISNEVIKYCLSQVASSSMVDLIMEGSCND
ncbi:TPA: hypothetical protein ACVOYT_000382 [Vibrio diabolicus]|uniref:hypothetical protein n=1 Tax=Vibrio diabolicus TaxID=50719 RepID=UPI00215EA400|nr:hypothetical protein [Vibrio diabolicus]MCS0451065.1 hypothetical protein [Vibrio diabolicus]